MNDLIVPIHDRRQRKRIITLKNFGWLALALAIIFLGLTIRSEMRHTSGNDYGRLFGKQVARQNDAVKPKLDVIKEAPVPDQTAADPLLVEAAARSQYLGADTMAPPPPVAPPPATASEAAAPPEIRGSVSGATIVGGPNGVTIVRGKNPRQPVLSGGIFKQP